MIKELENYLDVASENDLKFLLCFYVVLKNTDDDPISIELSFEKIVEIGKQYQIEIHEDSLLNLIRAVKVINYDIQTKMIRILPNDCVEILKFLKKPRKRIEEKNKVLISETNVKNSATFSSEELIAILKEMYENAPDGYQMTMVHLFGIKYADQLKNEKVKEIAIAATGKDSLYVEIGKGIKLSKYVKLIS